MAFYFRPFPTVSYRIPGTTKSVAATNITRRFSIANFINNTNVTFDEYYVQDGERPDSVAYDYYDDATLDWLVLLTNEIQDPYFEWVKGYEDFNKYIKSKYGSLEYAQGNIHHYEKIIQQNKVVMESNGNQRILPEKTLVVDYTTYVTIPANDRRAVSYYDFEVARNEKNRHIYLLDVNYTQLIKEQHPYIFDEGNPFR